MAISKNQKIMYAVIAIVVIAAIGGGLYYAYTEGDLGNLYGQEGKYRQAGAGANITSGCNYGTRSAAYPCTAGSCPSYGKPGNCPITNVADALSRPLLSIPSNCLSGPLYHGSPSVVPPQSPCFCPYLYSRVIFTLSCLLK